MKIKTRLCPVKERADFGHRDLQPTEVYIISSSIIILSIYKFQNIRAAYGMMEAWRSRSA